MPNPSELERQNQEEMERLSGTLNRDAYAHLVLEEQIEEQERIRSHKQERLEELRIDVARYEADIKTIDERIASLRDTLSRLEKPRG